ncbi:MAG: hypothetical protein RLZZ576_284, partial [Actinomycetota bacterium]
PVSGDFNLAPQDHRAECECAKKQPPEHDSNRRKHFESDVGEQKARTPDDAENDVDEDPTGGFCLSHRSSFCFVASL